MQIRRLGQNLHKYTVQCVLPYNLFYEKIYIFLWWWLVFVITMSILGVFVWLLTLLPKSSTRYKSIPISRLSLSENGKKMLNLQSKQQ